MAEQPMDFAAFHRDARDDCLRAVLASTGNRQLSEDLVAEAFARLPNEGVAACTS